MLPPPPSDIQNHPFRAKLCCSLSWRVRLFGNLRIEGPDSVITQFGTIRAAKMFALLCLSRNGSRARTDLADALWPEDFFDATRLRLRQELFRLKRALGELGDDLTASTNAIAFDRGQVDTDIDLLRRALKLPHDSPSRKAALREAYCGTDGEFLEGWSDLWVVGERHSAGDLRRQAGYALAECYLADSEFEEVLNTVQPLIAQKPLDEPLRMLAIKAHAGSGSMAAAVGEFQALKRLLGESGSEMSGDAEQLLQNLQSGRTIPPTAAVVLSGPHLFLPSPIDPMFGRVAEIQDIDHLLAAQARLITLIGPGGIGKTRLATEAGHLAKKWFTQVGFVAMGELDTPTDWAPHVLDQIGLQPPAQGDAASYLARTLTGTSTLLILDNLEHLLPDLAGPLHKLLQAAPDLAILGTSRVPLGLTGERVLTIGPLDIASDASEMLTFLWRASRGRSEPTTEQAEAITALAKRLDGYPLAIKLASSRLKFLSPQELADQIDSVVGLKSSAPDLPDRHRSLEATLSSSFSGLEPADREALAVVSAFRGGLTLEMGEAALGDDAGQILERLLDHSLLVLDDRSTRVRFRMLEPIREYAGQSSTDATARFLSVMTAWVQAAEIGYDRPMSGKLLRRLDEEYDNVLQALTILRTQEPEQALTMLARTWYWDAIRGRHHLCLSLMEELTSEMASLPLLVRGQLAIARIVLLSGQGREAEAVPFLEETEALFAALADPYETAIYRTALATLSIRLGMLLILTRAQVQRDAEAAIVAAEAVGNGFLLARGRSSLTTLAYFHNEPELAGREVAKAYEFLNKTDDCAFTGSLSTHYAAVLHQLGRTGEAEIVLSQATARLIEAGDPMRFAYMFEVKSQIAYDCGRFEEAEESVRESLRLWRSLDNAFQMADLLRRLSRLHALKGELAEARATLLESAENWLRDANLGGLCASIPGIARIYIAAGEIDAAAESLAYMSAFQAHHQLVIVEAQLKERDEMIEASAKVENTDTDFSAEAAKARYYGLNRLKF